MENNELILILLNKIKVQYDNFRGMFPDASTVSGRYPLTDNLASNAKWTNGFWTGVVWMAFEFSNEEYFKKIGKYLNMSFQKRINKSINLDHHDIGFLYIPSLLAEWKATGNEKCLKYCLAAADKLMERWNDKAKMIQAWGPMDGSEGLKIIIDSIMNVPLLFWAYEQTNKKTYWNIATNHLQTLTTLLFRANGSTFHTFDFDKTTGKPIAGSTVQGISNDSCWARGQAWAIYGLALAYKYTKDLSYANKYFAVADYFFNNLPDDLIPYWDLSFKPKDKQYRDTSSAAIAVSGILEMNVQLPLDLHQKKLLTDALNIFNKLKKNYLADKNTDGFLKEAVYNYPLEWGINEGCIWGDYFFMESLMKIVNPRWKGYW